MKRPLVGSGSIWNQKCTDCELFLST